jgi:DNA polymerase-3 subunit delta'
LCEYEIMKESEAYNKLISSFDAKRFAHAYIISGCSKKKGIEFAKNVMEHILVSTVADEARKDIVREKVQDRTALDAFWIEPENKSRSISIDQIREFLDDVYKTSYNHGWKVAVFVDADRLRQGAGNAFLKTLEEPPDRCVFFLIVENIRSLLPTIISRCQTIMIDAEDEVDENFEFYREVVDILVENRSETPAARLVSAMTIAKLFDDLFGKIKKDMVKMESNLASDEVVESEKKVIDARAEAMFKEKRAAIMKFLFSFYRDMFVLSLGSDESMIINKAFIDDIKLYLNGRTDKGIMLDMRCLENINSMMELNVRPIQALRKGFSEMRV